MGYALELELADGYFLSMNSDFENVSVLASAGRYAQTQYFDRCRLI